MIGSTAETPDLCVQSNVQRVSTWLNCMVPSVPWSWAPPVFEIGKAL